MSSWHLWPRHLRQGHGRGTVPARCLPRCRRQRVQSKHREQCTPLRVFNNGRPQSAVFVFVFRMSSAPDQPSLNHTQGVVLTPCYSVAQRLVAWRMLWVQATRLVADDPTIFTKTWPNGTILRAMQQSDCTCETVARKAVLLCPLPHHLLLRCQASLPVMAWR